jgi:hypothetical protein
VNPTLSLQLSTANTSFGSLVPGIGRNYDATFSATVTSTAGTATLSAADVTDGTGKLVNGTRPLEQPMQLRAQSAAGTGGPFAPLTGASNPVVLLNYATIVSNDAVTISLRQAIGANEPLRAGGYAKTVTFTLSTTQP